MSLQSVIDRIDQLTTELQPQPPAQQDTSSTSFADTLASAVTPTPAPSTGSAAQYKDLIDQAAAKYGVDP
ncbi:MAG: hypothetical protein JO073_14025, partial [Actinobacteria bacterium]|nr:hypothetical protein [Actinomycetota bacterium]